MRYFAIAVLALALAGCTIAQDEKAGETLQKTGETITKFVEVIKEIPTPYTSPVAIIGGAVSTILVGLGGYFKARAERKKKKAYKAQLTKEGLDTANKKLYGKKFKASKSKF